MTNFGKWVTTSPEFWNEQISYALVVLSHPRILASRALSIWLLTAMAKLHIDLVMSLPPLKLATSIMIVM